MANAKALARGANQHQTNFYGNDMRRGNTFTGRGQQTYDKNQYGLVHFFSNAEIAGLPEIGTARTEAKRCD